MASWGSRLPVGSSAKMIAGSPTMARAMATRCCSPPERTRAGRRRDREPDALEHLAHARADEARREPQHLERHRDVVEHAPARHEPEVLKHDADVAPEHRDRIFA